MTAASAQRIDGRSAYREAIEQLAGLAQKDVAIYSPRLPAYLYASEATTEALKQWARGSTRAKARIVVHEPRYAVAEPHRLIRLGLQLSSFFSFRDAPQRLEPFGDLVIVDGRHLLQRPQADSSVASLWLDTPLKAREALRDFDKLWEEATSSTEIRSQRI